MDKSKKDKIIILIIALIIGICVIRILYTINNFRQTIKERIFPIKRNYERKWFRNEK